MSCAADNAVEVLWVGRILAPVPEDSRVGAESTGLSRRCLPCMYAEHIAEVAWKGMEERSAWELPEGLQRKVYGDGVSVTPRRGHMRIGSQLSC